MDQAIVQALRSPPPPPQNDNRASVVAALKALSPADPLDQAVNYNTPLDPTQEAAFQAWAAQDPKRLGDLYDYDVRGWWKAGAHTAENGHGSDEWKKPNHPTFSDQSIYAGPYTPGGHWGSMPGGAFSFTPAQGNPRAMDAGDLAAYWAKVEAPSGGVLLPPRAGQVAGPRK